LQAKKLLGIVIIGISTFEYAAIYWLGDQNLWQVELLTSPHLNKPWVYRQLVPILARGVASLLGIRIDLALVLVVTVSGIGFYFALRRLAALCCYRKRKLDDTAELLIILLVVLGLVLFNYGRLPYDLMTAWLFTLAFRYIALGKDDQLTIVFALACLNRETAFLLLLFMGMITIFSRERFVFTLKLSLLFILIQAALHMVFRGNDGLEIWMQPELNLWRFIHQPARTLLHVAATVILLWIAAKDWDTKPGFLKLALNYIAPPLVLMYLIFGQAFETRVFWEVYPILALLMLPTLHDLRNGFLISAVL